MPTIRRLRRVLSAVAVTALVVAPATVWAMDRFDDVPDSNVFHDDITWLAEAGVTAGCNPPENSEFCPSDAVTREQMAAFMRRLAENQVVDADTVDGRQADELSPSVFTVRAAGMISTSFSDRTVLTLDLPAGSYVITSTAWLENPSGVTVKGECTLTADTSSDAAREGLDGGSQNLDTGALAMSVTHTFAGSGQAVLECEETTLNADISVYDAEITAIGVGSIAEQAISEVVVN